MATAPSPPGINSVSLKPAVSNNIQRTISRPQPRQELPIELATPLPIVQHVTSASQDTTHIQHSIHSKFDKGSENAEHALTQPHKQFAAKRRKHQYDNGNSKHENDTKQQSQGGRICLLLAAAPGITQLAAHIRRYEAELDSGHIATAMYRLAHLMRASRATNARNGLKPKPWVPPVLNTQQQLDDKTHVQFRSQYQDVFYDQRQFTQLVLLLMQLANQQLAQFDAATAITFLWSFAKIVSEEGAQQPSLAVLKRCQDQHVNNRQQPNNDNIGKATSHSPGRLSSRSNNAYVKLDETNEEYMWLYCNVCKHLAALGVAAANDNGNEQHRLRSHQFMMLTWSATQLRLGTLEQRLWPAITKRMTRLVKYLSARDTVTLAWCLATSRNDDMFSFDLITKRLSFMLRGEAARLLNLPPKPHTLNNPVTSPSHSNHANPVARTNSTAAGPDTDTHTTASTQLIAATEVADAATSPPSPTVTTAMNTVVTRASAPAVEATRPAILTGLHDLQAMHSQPQMPVLRQPTRPTAHNTMPVHTNSKPQSSIEAAVLPPVNAHSMIMDTLQVTNQAEIPPHAAVTSSASLPGGKPADPQTSALTQPNGKQPHLDAEDGTVVRSEGNAKNVSAVQPSFNGQDISNLFIAYAETGQSLRPLLPALETVALSTLPTMDSQHLANIAYTLAKTHTRLARLCAAIYQRATYRNMHTMKTSWEWCLFQTLLRGACVVGVAHDADLADQQLPAKHMAQLVWAAAQQRNLVETLEVVDDMDWQYAQQVKVRVVSETDLLKHLAMPIAACAKDLDASSASMVVWAYARLGVAAPEVFEAIAKHQANKLHALDHRGLATMLWAYVRSRSWHAALFGQLLKRLEALPLENAYISQIGSLHMVMMSLAHLSASGPLHTDMVRGGEKLARRHTGLIKRIVFTLQSHIERCTDQEVSNLAWAAAQLEIANPQLLADISDTVLKAQNRSSAHTNITAAQSQHSDDVASFDTNAEQPESNEVRPAGITSDSDDQPEQPRNGRAAMKQAAFRLRQFQTNHQSRSRPKAWRILDDMKAIECAKLVWAFAKAGHVDEELFAAVTRRFIAIARDTSPTLTGSQSTIAIGTAGRTMWAYAMQGRHDDVIFPLLMPYALATMRFAEPRDVAAMMWAMAASGQRDNHLIYACVKHAVHKASEYSCSQLSDTMWAIGVIHVRHKDTKRLGPLTKSLIDIVKQRVITETTMFRLQDIAAVLTGLARMQHQDSKLSLHIAAHLSRLLQGQHMKHTAENGNVLSTDDDSSITQATDTESSSDTAADSSYDISNVSGNEEADSEHIVASVYSFASLGQFHPTLYRYAALVVMKRLHLLDTEQLVQLIWSYSSTFHHVKPPKQESVLHQETALPERKLTNVAQKGDLGSVYCQVIEAAGSMLDQATPVQQSSSLTLREVSLLWQSHHCCLLWAQTRTAAATILQDVDPSQQLPNKSSILPLSTVDVDVDSSQQLQNQSNQPHSAIDCPQPPYQLHATLIEKYIQTAGMKQLATHWRRDMAELVTGLEALGFSTLGPSMATFDDVLAGCGPHWLGAVQGHIKLAVMLVLPHHMLRGEEAYKLLKAQHWVKGRLLAARGWVVAPIQAGEFRQRSNFTGEQAAFLRSEIDKAMIQWNSNLPPTWAADADEDLDAAGEYSDADE